MFLALCQINDYAAAPASPEQTTKRDDSDGIIVLPICVATDTYNLDDPPTESYFTVRTMNTDNMTVDVSEPSTFLYR